MELILGAAYQNKLEYVLNLYGFSKLEVADGFLSADKKVIYNLQDYILLQIKNGNQPREEIESFIKANPDMIFICNEVGGGIVPTDKTERLYRETVGRICTDIAGKSNKVHRVTCGIAQVIKDA